MIFGGLFRSARIAFGKAPEHFVARRLRRTDHSLCAGPPGQGHIRTSDEAGAIADDVVELLQDLIDKKVLQA